MTDNVHGASATPAQQCTGIVIAAHGRHYVVKADGLSLHCVTRGKKSDVAVGDVVELTMTSANQAVIDAIQPRSTLLYRSDQFRSKFLAANLTQLFIVVATEPGFSDDLISRALVAAEAAGIRVHLILNKTDIVANLERTRQRLQAYQRIGYTVHEVSALGTPEATCATLTPLLAGQSTIFIGQSGMGKSSLINILVPGAEIAVREISAALDTGKHTTTFTRLYQIDFLGQASAVIDSPGFQEFGLFHLTEGMLERAFPEFAEHLGHCRFYNCSHLNEPGCPVLEAVGPEGVAPARHDLYRQLLHEASQKRF